MKPAFLAILLLASCSRPPSEDGPQISLQHIVDAAKPPVTAKVMEVRTEPTEFPSHSAIIQAVDKNGDTWTFAVFRKQGKWYYDRPVALISGGKNIPADEFTTDFRIISNSMPWND